MASEAKAKKSVADVGTAQNAYTELSSTEG